MNLWHLLRTQWRSGYSRVLVVMCLIAFAIGSVIVALAMRIAGSAELPIPGDLAGALLGISIASFGVIWSSTRLGHWIGGLSRQIRRSIIGRYVALEPAARAEVDGQAVHDALVGVPRGLARLGSVNPVALQSLLTAIACAVVTLVIDPVSGAALLVTVKLGAIVTAAEVLAAHHGTAAADKADDKLDRALTATLRGMKQSLLAAPRANSAIETPLEAAIAVRRKAQSRRLALLATLDGMGGTGRLMLAVVLVAASHLSNAPSSQAVAMLVIAFLVPLDWIEAIPYLTVLSSSADRLAGFETVLRTLARRWPPPERSPADGDTFESIELRDAMFRHPALPGQPGAIVGPVSCVVAPGRILFVTGGTSAGKTSVLSMLAGIATPEGGIVIRNGSPVDVRRNRTLAALVTADPVLFAGMPIPNVARPDVAALIAELDLTDTASVRAERIIDPETLPPSTLARLALLIAVAGDRPLLLLDEWELRQEPALRDRFYQSIAPRLRSTGRALVIATRDERNIHLADGILRLDKGRQVS
jgi:putative pyoverdin transport system ATP-binding/permease protein